MDISKCCMLLTLGFKYYLNNLRECMATKWKMIVHWQDFKMDFKPITKIEVYYLYTFLSTPVENALAKLCKDHTICCGLNNFLIVVNLISI